MCNRPLYFEIQGIHLSEIKRDITSGVNAFGGYTKTKTKCI